MKTIKTVLILLIPVFLLISGCKTVSGYTAAPEIKEPLGLQDISDPLVYSLDVIYFNQNDIGITESVDQISASVLKAKHGEDTYIDWQNYRVRSFELEKETKIENSYEFDLIGEDDESEWNTVGYAEGFDYLVDSASSIVKDGQLSRLPDTSSIHRDMSGFRFYMNIVDFHSMIDIYPGMFLDEESPFRSGAEKLNDVGDTIGYSEEGHLIDLADWENVTRDLYMEGGYIYVEYLANGSYNGKETKIIYFQHNQRLHQNVYGPFSGNLMFEMRYEGTNRYSGILEITDDNILVRAFFNEYVYGKVHAPFFVKVLVHHKREYRLELKEGNT